MTLTICVQKVPKPYFALGYWVLGIDSLGDSFQNQIDVESLLDLIAYKIIRTCFVCNLCL